MTSGMKRTVVHLSAEHSEDMICNITAKILPSRRSIERVLEKFRSNGTINDLRFSYSAHTGRDLNLTPGKIERVKTLYKRKQKLSIRRAARLSNVSRYFVTKILKKVLKGRNRPQIGR